MPRPDAPGRMAREYAIMERIFELPMGDQFLTGLLAELVGALRRSEEAEGQRESGDDQQARGVINAAMLKDRAEGRPTDPRMTLGRAIARLEEQD